MLANFPELLDSLLIIAGLTLVVTGLVMFIRSKSSSDASSVEAFGIKLNVTHPSLILVAAGVGLMLAPRLLPGLPGKADKPDSAIVAEAPQPAEPATPAPSTPVPAEPDASTAAQPAPTPAPPAISQPVTPPPAAIKPPAAPAVTATPAPRPALAASKPQPATRPVPSPAPAATARPAPAAATSPAPATSPSPATALTPAVAAPTPPATPKPARPVIALAALGLPTQRDFWSGETRVGYTNRLTSTLQKAGRDVLRMDVRGMNLGQAAFDAWWNESRQFPRSRDLCAESSAPRALLAARVESPTTISSVESAFWPELKLRLFICTNQRVYRQQKTLSPNNNDAWPFETEFNSEIERFMRTYRDDLTE